MTAPGGGAAPSPPPAPAPRWAAYGAGALVLAALALSVAYLFTRAPWWDEGLYGDPARQFALHGRLGSPLLGASGSFGFASIPHADARTYWTTPLYPVVGGLWLRVAGVGVVALRLVSLAATAVLVAAWGAVVRRLTGSAAAALVAAGLIAANSHVLWSATIARPEALGAALAALAALAYLRWRERHLAGAVAASAALLAGAALAHPLAAVEGLALAALALRLDWRRIRPQHVALAVGVAALVAVPWALYIREDPALFRAQWAANTATNGGSRLAGLANPVGALVRDARDRYLLHHLTGVSGAARVLAVELAALVAALGLAAALPAVRRARGAAELGLAAAVSVVALAVLDGSRYQQYFLHAYPALVALAALPVAALAARGGRARLAAAALAAGLAGPGLAGLANRVVTSPYRRDYLPVADAVARHLRAGERVTAGSELAFAVGWDRGLVDDMELRTPADVYVQSDLYSAFTRGHPVQARLRREYRVAERTGRYRVWVRRDAAPAPAAPAAAPAPPRPQAGVTGASGFQQGAVYGSRKATYRTGRRSSAPCWKKSVDIRNCA